VAGGIDDLTPSLERIQRRLFDVASHVATPPTSDRPDEEEAARLQRTAVDTAWVTELEAWIDALDATLPPLKNFILPSGGPPRPRPRARAQHGGWRRGGAGENGPAAGRGGELRRARAVQASLPRRCTWRARSADARSVASSRCTRRRRTAGRRRTRRSTRRSTRRQARS
jgi:hypothetical protein